MTIRRQVGPISSRLVVPLRGTLSVSYDTFVQCTICTTKRSYYVVGSYHVHKIVRPYSCTYGTCDDHG